MADKFGRKTNVIVFAFMISFWGFLIAFPRVFWFYMLARFFVGVSRGRFKFVCHWCIHVYVLNRRFHFI